MQLTLNDQLYMAKLETSTPLTQMQEEVIKNISIFRNEDGSISFAFTNIFTDDGSGIELNIDVMPDGKFHTFCNKLTPEDINQIFHFDEREECDGTF